MDELTTERNFDSQATWVIDVFCIIFDVLSMGVCTTRHSLTSGRLVQEFNVCTVHPSVQGRLDVQYDRLYTAISLY